MCVSFLLFHLTNTTTTTTMTVTDVIEIYLDSHGGTTLAPTRFFLNRTQLMLPTYENGFDCDVYYDIRYMDGVSKYSRSQN